MQVTQITVGRFHHFHLARQLERFGLLKEIWTGYPRFKLKDEQGVSPEKIRVFPWVQTPYMLSANLGLNNWKWLSKEWEWLAQQTLDQHVAASIKEPTVVLALSSSGLSAGRKAQEEGGAFVCDRGSSHICYQNEILVEEYKKWGFRFAGIDPRIIEKEEAEYAQADKIFIPSEFVRRSFITKGVAAGKLEKVVYGARLDRFRKEGDPAKEKFTVLCVGQVSIRKGFMYLLEAFRKLKHPGKELLVAGVVDTQVKQLLVRENTDGVKFLGHVKNSALPGLYSKAHVLVLPSVEDGFGMVQGEAMACGCPVIASNNTGAEDLFTNGKEGFIVPFGSSAHIAEKLETLAQDSKQQMQMSEASMLRIKSVGGWNEYGNQVVRAVSGLSKKMERVAG